MTKVIRRSSGIPPAVIPRGLRVQKREAFFNADRQLHNLHSAFLDVGVSAEEMGNAFEKAGQEEHQSECLAIRLALAQSIKDLQALLKRFNDLPEED